MINGPDNSDVIGNCCRSLSAAVRGSHINPGSAIFYNCAKGYSGTAGALEAPSSMRKRRKGDSRLSGIQRSEEGGAL